MNKFLTKMSIFIGILLIILAMITVATIKLLPKNTDNYNYIHISKMERLDTLNSPRLIFVGGSNIAFGINSERISDSLSVNVQNAAVHAGIGLRYMLDDLYGRLRNGDIVVIMPEYSQFNEQFYGDDSGTLADVVLYGDGGSIKLLNGKQLINVISGFPSHLRGRKKNNYVNTNDVYVYSTSNFNEYGDEYAHWSRAPQTLKTKYFKQNGIDERVILEIAARVRKMEDIGVRVVFLWPTTIQSNYNDKLIDKISEAMKSNGIIFKSAPDYLVEPDSMAFDTPYHMCGEAVEDVTDKLIVKLREILK